MGIFKKPVLTKKREAKKWRKRKSEALHEYCDIDFLQLASKLKAGLIIGLLLVSACQDIDKKELGIDGYDSKKSSLRQLAQDAKENGNLEASAQLQQHIIELDKKDPDSFVALSKTLRKMGQRGEAKSLLEDAIKTNKPDDKLLIELSKVLMEMGDPDAALGRLSLVRKPSGRGYFITKGVALDMTDKHKEAQTTYLQGLKLNPKDDILLNNLALSYIIEKRYAEGIKILEALVDSPNSKPKYRQNLALAYGAQSNPRKAMEILLKDLSRKEAEENLEFYKKIR